jgi:choline transport protein
MGSDTSDMASKEFDNLNVAQSTVQHDGHDSHPPPTRAYFSGLNILAVGFNICSCWIGVGTTFPLAVASGGAATLIYGIVLVSFVFLCLGLTLAELASVYPTAGGQYHFASILAPTSISRGVSYACGTTAAFSWVAIVASVAVLISQGLLGIVREFVVSYDSKTWHLLLVYLVWSGVAMLYNLLLLRKTTWMYNIARK